MRVHSPASAVEAIVAITGGRVEPDGAHSCRLHLQVDDFDRPALILAAAGVDFDVVHPPEFRRYLHGLGERFLRADST